MARSTRTPRSSWIDEGLRALAAGGPDAVRIEPLAQALGVTKGGFYWHFATAARCSPRCSTPGSAEHRRGDRAGRARGRRRAGQAAAAVRAGLLRDRLLPIDLAVRDWSRREPSVAERLRRVDNRRMDYMRSLFGAFCPDEADVEARGLLALSLSIGNHFIAADHGARSRADVLELAMARLLA